MSRKKLWQCPDCGRAFANHNQVHACGRFELEDHFAGRSANVRRIFESFRALLEEFGPVTVFPEKSRIAFQSRISFAQLTLRRDWAVGHFILARRAEDPVFTKVETLSPRNNVHHFRLSSPKDVEQLRVWACEAAAVGRQEHLG